MPINDLRQFVDLLEQRGLLLRVRQPLSPELEITALVDRLSKGPAEDNKAVLVENPAGSRVPVLINAFGSEQRMSMALGVERLDDLNKRLAALIDTRLPGSLAGALGRGKDLFNALIAAGVKPRRVRSGPAQDVVITDQPNIDWLPILKCWPEDGGRFITLPQVITRNPTSGARNVGMYRLQVVDGQTLLVHWQRHKGGADHARRAQAEQKPVIPAAVVLGGSPAGMWCSSAPLPPEIDEYLLAGYLNGEAVEFVKCVSQPLEVPAKAEIVVEGYVDLNDMRPEGPFGDHTGYYTPVEFFPAFKVTAVTHRKDPVYPATVVGIPPMEDVWMGKATERLFLPLARLFLPEIIDFCMPAEGVFHNLVLVRLKKRYPGHARKVMHGLWGLGLLSLAKAIVVVDEWVDVQNLSQVAWQVLGNVDWKRDVMISEGPLDQLDHAASVSSYGGKIGIDATAKLPEEGYPRTWPRAVAMPDDVTARVDLILSQLKGRK